MTSAIEDRWQRGKLGDLLPLKYGKGLPEKSRDSSGQVPVFGSSGQVGRHSHPLTSGQTLIVGRKGTVGAVHLSLEPCWPIDTVYFAEAEEARNLKYYKYLLDSLDLARLDRSTAVPGLSRDDYNAIEVTIAPPREQERIVAEIEKQFSRLDEAVANLRRVKANLKRYKATVLSQAVNGNLVEPRSTGAGALESGADLVGRILDDRARTPAKKSGNGAAVDPGDLGELPALPVTWAWASLDQIGQEGRSVIYGIIKPGPDTPGGVPYVRVTEMKDGYVDVPNLRRANREREAKFSRARLLAGDLLISKDGTIGRVAVVPPELEGGNITQHVMRAPIHRFMNRDFVVWAIRSEFCQRWLTGETRGVALRGVNVEDFRRLPIPVPPRDEQDRIVSEVDRRLSIVREVEAEVDANLKRAQALRQGVLHRSFNPPL